MDQPILEPLVHELAASEKLRAFVGERGASARVSEPLLPLLLAAYWRAHEPGRGLLCLLPEDADARDAAEAVGWFVGPTNVGLFPSRGISFESDLRPAPHLVGERARALEILEQGGIVCASALGYGQGIPPLGERAPSVHVAVGSELGLSGLAERLALSGYERQERVEERGQIAVRGGLLDVFPATGREPVRIEFFGDEIESIRAFSPFTQRALHDLDEVAIFPAAEQRIDALAAPDAGGDDAGVSVHRVPAFAGVDVVWDSDRVKAVWREELSAKLDLDGAAQLDSLPRGQSFTFEALRPAVAARGVVEAENELAAFVRSGNRVVVTFAHRGEALRRASMLKKAEPVMLDPGLALPRDAELVFAVAPVRRGFVSRELRLALLPDTQVFRRRPPRTDARLGRALQSFADLRVGDYVVHEDQGVGKLLGFETKTVADVTRDYLFLAFRGDDRLYVPHEQIGKVSRYVGADGATPALSKLGGKAWQNIKTRAREGARELAGELVALYAQRQSMEGVVYEVDGDLVEQLEAGFPFEETPDQQRAIEAVKEDLEAPRPMDRLVCGDVGFGKTEIAVRAAFIAVANGKQALLLAPTTVLAQQHWNTFRQRFRDLPVRVELVSRFRKPAELKAALAEFSKGTVDVLVGTHRVLSRDVVPKNLGLVIIDEEQRFGVAQKELLRQLRLEVDVLALSATPIPRTLHMSLAGLRDISVIETPPQGRLPIRTHVEEYDPELVRTALTREHEREGQSFYLHNRVESIEERAEELRQLCPELRFLVAHGQLPERELEERMLAFIRGEADVLVATTIIESGLDIPQANTLVVERADTLGLAQLYQIRGRVGRSDMVAHAYLFYPDAGELSAEAKARLATLADHTELGVGFAIAMRDLEIRGAGDLLGAEQSGHVAAVGFELYVELLGEAVAELSGARRAVARPVRVDVQADAYVPASYIGGEAAKIDLHRRIALAESEDDLRELRATIADRFGAPPEPVERLFQIQEAKLKLARLGADYLVLRQGRATVGRLVLGSEELQKLRVMLDTAVYSGAKHEVSLRADTVERALELVDTLLAPRVLA